MGDVCLGSPTESALDGPRCGSAVRPAMLVSLRLAAEMKAGASVLAGSRPRTCSESSRALIQILSVGGLFYLVEETLDPSLDSLARHGRAPFRKLQMAASLAAMLHSVNWP